MTTALTELKKELAAVDAQILEAEADMEAKRQVFMQAQGQLIDARQVLTNHRELRSRYQEAISALEYIEEADRG